MSMYHSTNAMKKKYHIFWKLNSLVDTLLPTLQHPHGTAPRSFSIIPTSSPTPTTPTELSKIPGVQSLYVLLFAFNSRNFSHMQKQEQVPYTLSSVLFFLSARGQGS